MIKLFENFNNIEIEHRKDKTSEIKRGSYKIYRNGKPVGEFGISKVGDIEIDINNSFDLDYTKIYKNSIFFIWWISYRL